MVNGAKRFEHFCRQSLKEQSCIFISKSMYWLRKRSRLIVFYFGAGGDLIQQSGTALAIFVEGYPRNIPVKLYLKICPPICRKKSFKFF